MPRFGVASGLVAASLAIGGCSSAHPVMTNRADTAQWRLYRPGMEQPPRRVRTASRPSPRVLARSAHAEVETTGTVAQGRAQRPWPRVGTPEWNELQAEDAERERRVQNAIRNICRGC
jgi:hypothetical protein